MTTALHDLIHSRRDLLVERYLEEVNRRMRPRGAETRTDLVNDLGAFLSQLVYALLRAEGKDVPEANVENPARTHGAQRFQLGGDLASLIDEYALVRRMILDLATEAGVQVTNTEAAVLSRAIDDGIRAAVLEYTAAKDAERHKDEIFRETFIGILGHDLRTPLNAIVVGTRALLRHDLGEAQTSVVRRVVRSADRMSRMIGELLDFARGRSADGIPVVCEPVDLRDLCEEVVDEVRIVNPGPSIEVSIRGGTAGAWDRDRLSQALSNLVSNAITYGAHSAPVRVRVEGNAERVEVAVTNHGPVIEPHEIPKLFDPFLRGRQGHLARSSGGLGLGLFIANQIVIAHGGTLCAVSSADEGTTFTMSLPRQPARLPAR